MSNGATDALTGDVPGRTSGLPEVVLSSDAPYPGLAAFEERHAEFFKGRDAIVRELLQAVDNDMLTLLYGASGLGKTSLLAAGLVPKLRLCGYFPVVLRLDFGASRELSESVIDQVTRAVKATHDLPREQQVEFDYLQLRKTRGALEPAPEQPEQDVGDGARDGDGVRPPESAPEQPEQDVGDGARDGDGVRPPESAPEQPEQDEPEELKLLRRTLWGFFRTARFWDCTNHRLTPVLVFDQFEELFTIGRGDPRSLALVRQLADAVHNEVPEALRAVLRKLELPGGGEAPRFRCVLSAREDFVPEFDELRALIPAVVSRRHRLTQLKGDEAVDAVHLPSPALISRAVATKVVRRLARENREAKGVVPAVVDVESEGPLANLQVEPALLSLFCQGLNKKRVTKGASEITAVLVDEAASVIIRDFYSESMAGIDIKTRDFVEDELISISGYRTTVALSTAEARGANPQNLKMLIERRLLRREERFGEPHVELIHDVLTAEVRQLRDARRTEEERLRMLKASEALRREAQRQADEVAAQVRIEWRLRVIRIALLAVGAVLLLSAGAVAYVRLKLIPEREREAQRGLAVERAKQLVQALRDEKSPRACDALLRDLQQDSGLASGLGALLAEGTKLAEACRNQGLERAKQLQSESERLLRDGRKEEALIRRLEAAIERGETKTKIERDEFLPDKRLRFTLRGHGAVPRTVVFSTDDRLIYSGADDGVIVWDTESGQRRQKLRLPCVVRHLSVARWKGAEVLVASCSMLQGKSEGAVAIWDPSKTGLDPTLFPFTKRVEDAVLVDDQYLVTAYNGVSWQVPGGAARALQAQGFFTRLAWDPQRRRLAATGNPNQAHVWSNLPAGPTLRFPKVVTPGSPKVRVSAFDPRAERIALGFANGSVSLHALSGDAEPVALRDVDNSRVIGLVFCAKDPSFLVAGISGEGEQTKDGLGAVRIDVAPPAVGRSVPILQIPGAKVRDLTLSADCSLLVSAWSDGTVRISDVFQETPVPDEGDPQQLLQQLRRRLGLQSIEATDSGPAKTELPTPGDIAPEQAP